MVQVTQIFYWFWEKATFKEHYKSKVEELKQTLESISSNHQDEINDVIAKYSEKITDCKDENQSKVCLFIEI